MKILIVDDEPHIRLLLEQNLEDLEGEGVEILTAADGQQGLDSIKAEQPDLVFLDVMMPRINGFDVCQIVKQELKMDNTYIVLLTAKGQEYDRQHGEAVGADQYLTKPFDPDALLALAKQILGL
jgi:two-component system alkaline phosphatase synthesis response regulator PhoP